MGIPIGIDYLSTDLKLLKKAREKSEAIIDVLHAEHQGVQKNSRTYHKVARKAFLLAAKNKRLSKHKMHKALRR